MADKVKITANRPVRVDKKRLAKGESATVDEAIAVQLVEIGAASIVPDAGDAKGGSKKA